ncbi:MAG: IS110 family transposase, partial [Gammaproteobacteria bacterium]
LLAALLTAEVPVTVLNPAQVAAFRTSRLGRHKTDRADAQLLARFAALHHGELRLATPDEPDWAQLRTSVRYRDDLIAQQTAARNRLHAARWTDAPEVVAWLERDRAGIAARLREVEARIAALLATRPETPVLLAPVGVGLGTAAAVLAYLPAGVLGNPKAAAAYAGLHPRQAQSGQRRRSRLSKQGGPPLRRSLYLAALAAIRCDPEMAAWHQRWCARGKPAKSATCAVAHKLLRRSMGKIRDLRQEQHLATPPWPLDGPTQCLSRRAGRGARDVENSGFERTSIEMLDLKILYNRAVSAVKNSRPQSRRCRSTVT